MYGYYGSYMPYHPTAYERDQIGVNPALVSPKGFEDRTKFLQNVMKAIYNEREAQLFYRALYDRAQTPFQRRQIGHALEDEVKHERKLTQLYQMLTGQMPQVPMPEAPEIADFEMSLRDAFEDELEAVELYRNMYMAVHYREIRDLMLELFTDEVEHAQRFTYIRAEL
ncbi:MAG TPA: ferritin-like domain-containing protein [Bacilli bacterium]|nr:ferritin-like domain-containing protein [Bacilli bacterium]